jgi:glycosyltransferase involved in cell wall biosynthesis
MYKLTIAICTLPVRINSFASLITELNNQIRLNGLQNQVQIVSLMDCKDITVGDKRNYLKSLAKGQYLVYIDDDDRISGDYVISLIQAMITNPDVITFRGEYKENGRITDFIINCGVSNQDTPTHHYRLPNHICAVKRDIYLNCHFTSKNYGEDSDYADQINQHIKTECHIPKKLYFYDFALQTSQTHPQSKTTAYTH